MAYRIAASGGSWKEAGLALGNMAQRYIGAGDYRRALALLRRAIALSLRGGNLTGAGHFRGVLAGALHAQGRNAEALQAAREAVQTLQEARNLVWLPQNLRTLARICAAQGLWDEADSAHVRTAAAFEKMRELRDLAHLQYERALLQLAQHRPQAARGLWRDGQDLVRRHGVSSNNAEAENRMRRLCAELGIPPLDSA